MLLKELIPPVSCISEGLLAEGGVELKLLRLDLVHPVLNGNKAYKLKYNLEAMQASGKSHLVTFGGAYSNHIAAVAATGSVYGLQTTGIIRGEEHIPLNETLRLATAQGMQLHYVNRELYRDKAALEHWTRNKFGEQIYLLPEGGSNALAVQGCREILNGLDYSPDIICCACGTGATLAGIASSEKGRGKTIGFSALRDSSFFTAVLAGFADEQTARETPVIADYHFGGYGKVKPELLEFVSAFYSNHGIQLDYLYNGKMLFGIYDRIRKGAYPKGTRILAVHSGGVQGNAGF
jgi:1-aminocyclopropane-1-carboxylate deaminase